MKKKSVLKKVTAMTMALGICLSSTTTAFAEEWKQDDKGWWIQNDDGSYLANQWYQSPTSGLWYYMGANGYMLTDSTTPDGYYVNADGVYVESNGETESSREEWKDDFCDKWLAAYKVAADEAFKANSNAIGRVTYTFTTTVPSDLTEEELMDLCNTCAARCYPPRRPYCEYEWRTENGQLTITATSWA